MNKNPVVFLDHILDAVEKIESFLVEIKKKDFVNDYRIHDVVIRELQIIGEATANIPEIFYDKWSKIPWGKIRAFRNVMVHEYFNIDLDRVWGTVKKDLKKLKNDVQKIKKHI